MSTATGLPPPPTATTATGRPPPPTAVDMAISLKNGITIATEALPSNLQQAKSQPTPSMSQIIEQRTRENGRLRAEVAYCQRKDEASRYLLVEIEKAFESLRKSLMNYHNLRTEIENEYTLR